MVINTPKYTKNNPEKEVLDSKIKSLAKWPFLCIIRDQNQGGAFGLSHPVLRWVRFWALPEIWSELMELSISQTLSHLLLMEVTSDYQHASSFLQNLAYKCKYTTFSGTTLMFRRYSCTPNLKVTKYGFSFKILWTCYIPVCQFSSQILIVLQLIWTSGCYTLLCLRITWGICKMQIPGPHSLFSKWFWCRWPEDPTLELWYRRFLNLWQVAFLEKLP